MPNHPFQPLIPKNATKLLVGTLPPERVSFYFSNSANTRLWDILTAIKNNQSEVPRGGNNLSAKMKTKTLESLNLGISDIIYGYERDTDTSTRDEHIMPTQYSNLLQLAIDNNISELLFVYQNALNWFNHSLTTQKPCRIKFINTKYKIGPQKEITVENKIIKCTLLPSPLNRGRRDETLQYKLDFYRNHILANG